MKGGTSGRSARPLSEAGDRPKAYAVREQLAFPQALAGFDNRIESIKVGCE